ncbi:DUF21 domain-containing protein [Candidatus Uhrbacteria bacterium]|nr:DUF21 domain-containing protein [Candidatus Uhrbacteria bacterium]
MEYVIVAVLLSLSAVFSGLTLGLLSLDKHELERKMILGDRQAARIFAVRKRGNLLLCTLLLGNVAVNTSIAIVMNSVAGGLVAGIVSTILIVAFGEILPQAIVPRFAMSVGSRLAWLVRIATIILYPIVWPLAWVLDRVLGDEVPTIYSKRELVKIMEEHEVSRQSDVDEDEYRIVKGALSYSDRTAEDVMTPRTVLYALDADTRFDMVVLADIRENGFTRIPVYEGEIDRVVGLLYVKKLIGADVMGKRIGDVCQSTGLLTVNDETKLDSVLNSMLRTKNHMAFVTDDYGGLSGIVTMEDIMEEIIDSEIMDETDDVRDMQEYAKEKERRIGRQRPVAGKEARRHRKRTGS